VEFWGVVTLPWDFTLPWDGAERKDHVQTWLKPLNSSSKECHKHITNDFKSFNNSNIRRWIGITVQRFRNTPQQEVICLRQLSFEETGRIQTRLLRYGYISAFHCHFDSRLVTQLGHIFVRRFKVIIRSFEITQWRIKKFYPVLSGNKYNLFTILIVKIDLLPQLSPLTKQRQ